MFQQAEYDHNDFNPSHMREADKVLLVKFFLKPRLNKAESAANGRPIYHDVEYIDIRTPGDRNGGVCRPATHMDKQRFAEHYRRFKDRTEDDIDSGTPLSEWPPMSRSMCEELAFFHVKTVEQLANMADSQITKFMGLYQFREKARKWLEQAEKDRPFHEMETKMDALKKENEELKQSVAELVKMVEGAEDDDDNDLNDRQKARRRTRLVKSAKETVA